MQPSSPLLFHLYCNINGIEEHLERVIAFARSQHCERPEEEVEEEEREWRTRERERERKTERDSGGEEASGSERKNISPFFVLA